MGTEFFRDGHGVDVLTAAVQILHPAEYRLVPVKREVLQVEPRDLGEPGIVQQHSPEVNPNRNGWSFWIVSRTGKRLQTIRYERPRVS